MNYCGSCGYQIQQNNAKFCPQCGIQLPQADAPGPPVVPPPQAPVTPETSGLAIGSLICGILFFIFPSAIAAIVMGHISRAEIRRSGGRKTGAGMAMAGLVLGYIGVSFIPILIIAAIAIPNLLRSKMAENEAFAVGSLRALNTSAVDYSTAYGIYPPSLAALGPSSSPSPMSADLIDSVLAAGTKSGYVFDYEPFNAEWGGVKTFGYSITASPNTPGTTGQRYFFTDQTGVIRVEADRVATANSPPVN
jgi:type IV pilus assembly protein PilA